MAGMTVEAAMRKMGQCGEYVGWDGRNPLPVDGLVCLDGRFDLETLEALVVLMRAAGKESCPTPGVESGYPGGRPPRR